MKTRFILAFLMIAISITALAPISSGHVSNANLELV